jgi:hypothetical protein
MFKVVSLPVLVILRPADIYSRPTGYLVWKLPEFLSELRITGFLNFVHGLELKITRKTSVSETVVCFCL